MSEMDEEAKILELQKHLPYYCYQKLIDNNFSNNQYNSLYDEIFGEFEGYDFQGFDIVDKPKGQKHKREVLDMWINQTLNGGFAGDSFAGFVYVKISDNNYLRWGYSC